MTEADRYAETDRIGEWAQTNRFAAIACGLPDARPPVDVVPATLANAMVPRRNIVAEHCALSTERLIEEAEELLNTLRDRPRAYAIVVALKQRLRNERAALDGALWLDLGAAA